MTGWIKVCELGDIDEEDLIAFEYGDRSYAIYNTSKGYFATDGYCTHEEYPLEDGMVIGTVIECPLHQGRFEITTGKALSAPVCVDLRTYPIKVDNGAIFMSVD